MFPRSATSAVKMKINPARVLENYRSNYIGPSAEERAEIQAAFGPGATVIDVITGLRV